MDKGTLKIKFKALTAKNPTDNPHKDYISPLLQIAKVAERNLSSEEHFLTGVSGAMKRKRGSRRTTKKGKKRKETTAPANDRGRNLVALNTEDNSGLDALSSAIDIDVLSHGHDFPSKVSDMNGGGLNDKPVGRGKGKLRTSKTLETHHTHSNTQTQSDTEKTVSDEHCEFMESMEDAAISLPAKQVSVSEKVSKKPGTRKNKSSKGLGSSSAINVDKHINRPNSPVQIPADRNSALIDKEKAVDSSTSRELHKESSLPDQDCQYNENELSTALEVIKKIMKMDAAEPFNAPVNPVALGVPDYFDIIETPMDFGTICCDLEHGHKYVNSEEVFRDVQFIWENCCRYNNRGGYILNQMNRVKKNFMKYWMAAGLHCELPRRNSGTMSHCTSSSSSASTVQGSSHEGGLPSVTFGENGQPIGDNSVQLSSKIGEVVRTYVSPIFLKWTEVPNELKELVWEIVRHSFEVPEYSKRLILRKANNSWKNWKSNLRLKVLDKYQTDVERKSNIPEGVKKEDWESFVELNSTSQAHSLRQKGKAARKALKCPHTSGRKGQAQVAAELSQQNPDGLVTRTQVYLATHGRKDGATGNQYLDEIDMLIQHDPSIVEKDLNHDPVALALGRDNRGRVRGLGMGVSKTAVHHSTPYRRYEMASQAAIKTAVVELKEQNIQLRERLEEESRERKRMEKQILSCLSQGQTVMQPSTDNDSSSQVRHGLPPQDARSCRLMHLTRKSTCIAYGRVRGLSTEEEECYKVIVEEIIEGSVELMGGGKSFQDLTLGDTIDWPIFRTTFV